MATKVENNARTLQARNKGQAANTSHPKAHIATCGSHDTHNIAVAAAKANLPEEQMVIRLSDFYKVFGDPTRLKILFALESRELCVCDLAQILQMTKSAVSHQLKILRQTELVNFKKLGRSVFYRLSDAHIQGILDQGADHINEFGN